MTNFRFFCQKVLPLVYDDSLSYYEVLCKVVKYLNEAIDELNTQGEAIEDLYSKLEELKEYVDNYFDNLDVQEEINNKLDDMAESGELASMFAVFMNYVTPEMYGAVGDGTTLDTDAMKSAVETGMKVMLDSEKTYLLDESIYLNSNQVFDGNGSKLVFKLKSGVAETQHNCLRLNTLHNTTVKNITIVQDESYDEELAMGLRIAACYDCYFENITIEGLTGDGVIVGRGSHDCFFNNIIVKNNLINFFAFEAYNITVDGLYSYGGNFQYTVQFKSCYKCKLTNATIEKSCNVSLMSSIESQEDAEGGLPENIIVPYDMVFDNIYILEGSYTTTPAENTACALLVQGNNYNISNVVIKDCNYDGIRHYASYTNYNNVTIDGYAKSGSNFRAIRNFANNVNFVNLNVKNGVGNVVESNGDSSTSLSNIKFVNVTIEDAPSRSSSYAFQMLYCNNVKISNVHFIENTVNFTYFNMANSSYIFIDGFSRENNVAEPTTKYVFAGNRPTHSFVNINDASCVTKLGNAGTLIDYTGRFSINDNNVEMYVNETSASNFPDKTKFSSGDKVFPLNQASAGYVGFIHASSEWKPFGAIVV